METARWQLESSWDELGWTEMPNGIRWSTYSIGPPGTSNAPTVFLAKWPPGVRVEAHTHACDYTEIILEGSEQVTRRWHHAGAVRVIKAGTVYGPLIAGPEGVIRLVVFCDSRSDAIYASSTVQRSSTSSTNAD